MDWKNPDYEEIFWQRGQALKLLREKVAEEVKAGANRTSLDQLKDHYRANPADFISDWGVTFDPRNADIGLPTIIPFILFDRQREWVDWVIKHWQDRQRGLTEKSRDMGLTWLAISLGCTLCIFHDNLAIGFGSRLVDYVDKLNTMKPLLPKARMFMKNLPEEFRAGWVEQRDAPYMRILFPESGSIITGEGGDQIGRGDRQAIYVIDEAAYLDNAESVENSLSFTTNCRIDLSSVNGMNNVFAANRHSGKIDVFIFDWREDPRKDQAWYDKLPLPESEGGKGFDPVTIAQEVDRDYSASVEGIVIPGTWVRSAIDADKKLGIALAGAKGLSLDVADEGTDKNAACISHGTSVQDAREWSGKGADIFATVQWTFGICDELGISAFDYDADGLGAGVRGDARVINAERSKAGVKPLRVAGWRGSEAVVDPDGVVEGTYGQGLDKGRTNKDFFLNRKAQGWWTLRRRFMKTHRWVVDGIECPPDDIISISSQFPNYKKLVTELSQPTYSVNQAGKMVIEKKPNGMKSPNLADACMMRFAPKDRPGLEISGELLQEVRRRMAGPRRSILRG